MRIKNITQLSTDVSGSVFSKAANNNGGKLAVLGYVNLIWAKY